MLNKTFLISSILFFLMGCGGPPQRGRILWFSSLGSPTKWDKDFVFGLISNNRSSIESGYVKRLDGHWSISYIGSDEKNHYFGVYCPSALRLPLSDDIQFVYLLRSEISISLEQALNHSLGNSADSKDWFKSEPMWKIPVSSPVDSTLLKDYLVLATPLPSENK